MPRPTLVTTGTGSGKTESFLIPLLEHCRRQRRAGQRGIKALVLYPMNALANDQARRIARLVHTHSEALGDVRVGLYTGDSGKAAAMTETGVVEDKYAMRADPPDILLTNYKMLDMLLLRREDVPLFEGAGESLRYLVLDEFHTYDGAQGTDVAMLLRRLGMALGVTTDERPLGAITPVATSATLGGGSDGGPKLREFAETVFGAEFDEDVAHRRGPGDGRGVGHGSGRPRPAARPGHRGAARVHVARGAAPRGRAPVRARRERGRPRSAGAGGVAARAPVHPSPAPARGTARVVDRPRGQGGAELGGRRR